MKTFTLLKGFLSLFLSVLIVTDVFSQSATSVPSVVPNSSVTAVTLSGTPPTSRRFISPGAWTFISGPQVITVGGTSFSPNQTSNNNTATASASFPSGAAIGIYTFRLAYTVTTNTSGTTTTTGTLDVTVEVTIGQPANPAAGSSTNCTTNAAITTCPANSSGVQTNFVGGVYNRGNSADHLGSGAIWRFTNIATSAGIQVNAEIKIDAIYNATLENSGSGTNTSSTAMIEDDNALNQSNSSIAGYFAPRIAPNATGNGNARGYVQFTMSFFNNSGGGFSTPQNLTDLNFVHLDIDGNGNSAGWFRETGVALKSGAIPTVIANAGTELVSYSYTDNSTSPGGSWTGYAGSVFERDGVSTCAEVAVAYRYAGNRNSVTFRMGYDYKGTSNPGTGARQYGATFGCFNFPTEIPLPVKLVYFKGSVENNVSKLNWQSSSEENISGYTVQRSYMGSEFTDVGFVQAMGRGNVYNYNDPLVNTPDKIYYRLKVHEMNNSFTYSNVIVLKTSSILGNVVVMPNPFKKDVQLSIPSNGSENVMYALFNSEGKQLRKASQTLSRGTNVFFINDLESLQPGIYFLQVRFTDEVKTIKLLKNQ